MYIQHILKPLDYLIISRVIAQIWSLSRLEDNPTNQIEVDIEWHKGYDVMCNQYVQSTAIE